MQLEVKDLRFTYLADTPLACEALSGLSFSLADGDFLGIMGKTGCGKSTLIQLLAGLMEPSAGSILIDGKDINRADYDKTDLRRHLSIVFQYPEYQLFESTVEKDVAFSLKYMGMDKKEMEKRTKEALEMMGFSFDRIRKKSPLALSSGEKRRVAIAGALAVKPEILIFDEPFAGLDPFAKDAFIRILHSLNSTGVTIIIVSHDSDSLFMCTKHMMVLDSGRLKAFGNAMDIFQDSSLFIVKPQILDVAERLGLKKPCRSYAELLDGTMEVLS